MCRANQTSPLNISLSVHPINFKVGNSYRAQNKLLTCTHTGGPFMYMIFCIPLGLGKEDEWSYGNDEM